MSDWVAGAGLSVSEGSPGVSGLRPPTPPSIHLTSIDSRVTSADSPRSLALDAVAFQKNLGHLPRDLGLFAVREIDTEVA